MQRETIEFSQFGRFMLGVERERKSYSRFLKLTEVVELETDNAGSEFHSDIFGPKFKIVTCNCLIFVRQKCGL